MDVTKITLEGVVPFVFSSYTSIESQVWASSLELRRGTHYLLSAKSGAGKSSLCSFLLGLRNDYQGSIRINDKDIQSFSISEKAFLRKSSIAYLAQDLALFKGKTAWENVLLKNNLTKALSIDEINELFDCLGLIEKKDTPIDKLSIGQQQRVALIRCLCQKAQFFLLDEPVSHLDPENNKIVGQLLQHYAQRWEASVLATSVGYTLDFPFDETLLL